MARARVATGFAAPAAIIVSTSSMPSPAAIRCPSLPSAVVATPVPAARADCFGVSRPSALSWRVPSAAPPAEMMPSPMAPCHAAPTFGTMRPATPPASMSGADSVMACPMVEGLVMAAMAVPSTPWASSTDRLAFCCWSEYQPVRMRLASPGRNPSDSSVLPARPPVTMSARPTAASGSAMAPLSAEIPTSVPRRLGSDCPRSTRPDMNPPLASTPAAGTGLSAARGSGGAASSRPVSARSSSVMRPVRAAGRGAAGRTGALGATSSRSSSVMRPCGIYCTGSKSMDPSG